MNMQEKIKMLMKERNLTKASLSKGSGIPYTTIDGIFKKDVASLKRPTLDKLAKFFDVSMEYLYTDTQEDRNLGKVNQLELTKEEHQLIYLWRQLSREEQLKMLGRIEGKVENGKEA